MDKELYVEREGSYISGFSPRKRDEKGSQKSSQEGGKEEKKVTCIKCNGTGKIYLRGYEAFEYRNDRGRFVAITTSKTQAPEFRGLTRKYISVPGKHVLCGCSDE